MLLSIRGNHSFFFSRLNVRFSRYSTRQFHCCMMDTVQTESMGLAQLLRTWITERESRLETSVV